MLEIEKGDEFLFTNLPRTLNGGALVFCARLILKKNLYGLDIDLRATDIACFALYMKAMEDDPAILLNGSTICLNLFSFRDCSPEDREEMIQLLNPLQKPVRQHIALYRGSSE